MFKKGDRIVRVLGDDYPEDGMLLGRVYTYKKGDKDDLFVEESGAEWVTYFFILESVYNSELYQLLNKGHNEN